MRLVNGIVTSALAGGLLLGCASAVQAQAYRPSVALSVTLPDGHVQKFQTYEGGLSLVNVGGHEYGFRPTMLDDVGARYIVTVFEMGNATHAVRVLGDVDVKGGGVAVSSKTTPMFQIGASRAMDSGTP